MDYKDFQNAITGAPNIQVPTSDPALAKLFGSQFQLAQSNRGVQGLGVASQYNAQAQENSMKQRAAEIQDRLKQIKDENDPKNFQKVKKDDGGFDFLDPKGNKIDINTYAKVTGKSPKDVLSDSENNLDIQFREDYKTMQDIANAFANGDKEYLDKLAEDSGDPKFFQGKTAADIMQIFKKGYPHIYGMKDPGTNVRPVEQAPAFTGGGGMAPAEAGPNLWDKLKGLFM